MSSCYGELDYTVYGSCSVLALVWFCAFCVCVFHYFYMVSFFSSFVHFVLLSVLLRCSCVALVTAVVVAKFATVK